MDIFRWILVVLVTPALLAGCATEQSRAIAPTHGVAATLPYHGVRTKVAIGRFDNRSSYLRGVFSSGDRLGDQAKTILTAHLQESGRFSVLDRSNMGEIEQETKFSGAEQAIAGADFVLAGSVTEFGRKEVGDKQLFGILGRGKSQIAYAKVTLNVVDVRTSEVVHSVQGAGEYSLSEREVLGFGGTAGYDSTLNGKVLDLAIREAVDNLSGAIDAGAWRP